MQLTEQQIEVAKAIIKAIGSSEEYKRLAYLNQSSEPNPLSEYDYVYANNIWTIHEIFNIFLIDYDKAYYIIDNPRMDIWLFYTYADVYDWEIDFEVFYDFFKFLESQIKSSKTKTK